MYFSHGFLPNTFRQHGIFVIVCHAGGNRTDKLLQGNRIMPSVFTAPLYTADVGRVEGDRPIRVVLRAFEYRIGSATSNDKIQIPVGYCSDGASVPRVFRSIISPWGKYAQAAIVHDLLYSTNARPRQESDDIFAEAIEVLGRDLSDQGTWSGSASSWWGWMGVRIGGASGYRNGASNYVVRASRAKDRALQKDPELATVIITDPADLI
jgi:hypothetical protein